MSIFIFRLTYITVVAGLLVGLYLTSQSPKTTIANPGPQKPVIDTALQSEIATWVDKQSDTYSIAVQELTGKERVARHNGLEAMPTASTYKLFVAYAVLHKIEQNQATLQTTLDSGDTVQTCLRKMITFSDNTCGRALGFWAGWSETEKLLKTKGIGSTYLHNYDANDRLLTTEKTSPAQDHIELLRLLERKELLNQEHTDLLLGYLKKQQWRERIPAVLPENIIVANKPGFLPGMQNDAGIVYGPTSTYAVAILSDGDQPENLAILSRLIYDYLQK